LYSDAFIGREIELEALRGLREASIVSLVGPGGVGKTRLAVEFARGHAGRPWSFCSAADVRSTAELVTALAQCLEVSATGTRSQEELLARIVRYLSTAPAQVCILDNLEDCTPAACEVLTELWDTETQFLTTSRLPLGVRGEQPLPIPPLRGEAPIHDAMELFFARVPERALVPVDRQRDRAVVEDLVTSLDGLPLAIELAAARLELLTLGELSARLTQRFSVLRAPGASPDDRHGSLWRTIAWSWDLLEPRERQALAELSVCRGGFAWDAALAILGPDRVEAVRGLLRHHLVRSRGEGDAERFSIPENVRAFAGMELDLSGTGPARERHARWFGGLGVALSDGAFRHGSEEVRRKGCIEAANLRVAVEVGLALGTPEGLHAARGAMLGLHVSMKGCDHYQAFKELLGRTLDGGGAEDILLARLLRSRAINARFAGEIDAAEADLGRALDLCLACGDRGLEGLVRLGLAGCAARGPSRDAARVAGELRLALAIAAEMGDRHLEGRALLCRAILVHQPGGRNAEAESDKRSAAALLREAGDSAHEGIAVHGLAVLCAQAGRYPEARSFLERAIVLLRRDVAPHQAAQAQGLLGLVEHAEGRLDEAESAYRRAITTFVEPAIAKDWMWALALLHLERGEVEAAVTLAKDVLDDRLGWVPQATWAVRAIALARWGSLEEARSALAGARSARRPPGTEPLAEFARIAVRAAEIRAAYPPGPDPDVVAALEADLDVTSRSGGPLAVWVRVVAQDVGAVRHLAYTWTIDPGGAWFRSPRGAAVELAHRAPMVRVLAALVAARKSGTAGLSLPVLATVGWPGEVLVASSARNRVQNAVSTLRTMGLDILVLSDGLYRLDPAVRIRDPDSSTWT
jgi:tetratricopeptide (TPR) repeat protein